MLFSLLYPLVLFIIVSPLYFPISVSLSPFSPPFLSLPLSPFYSPPPLSSFLSFSHPDVSLPFSHLPFISILLCYSASTLLMHPLLKSPHSFCCSTPQLISSQLFSYYTSWSSSFYFLYPLQKNLSCNFSTSSLFSNPIFPVCTQLSAKSICQIAKFSFPSLSQISSSLFPTLGLFPLLRQVDFDDSFLSWRSGIR